MQRRILARIASIFLILAVVLPTHTASPLQAEEAQVTDDEIVYIDTSGRIIVIDPNVAQGTTAITWQSPDTNWFDIATGDFNADGDDEIVAIGNGNRVTIFDPVMQPNSGLEPTGVYGNVPWRRLYDLTVSGPPNIVSAGNLDQFVAGDEIVFGYSVNEPNNIVHRMTVLKRNNASGTEWTTHIFAPYGATWKFVRAGNIDNQGSEDIIRLRDADTAAAQAAQIDNNWATIFERSRSGFTYTSAAIGQFIPGGTGEVALTRTFPGTTEAPSVIVYQFTNNQWTTSGLEYTYFPHPYYAFYADINGNGDDELFWIRDQGSVRLVMINAGGDGLPSFEVGLDSDQYRIGAGGDIDADGKDEIIVLRAGRILQFNAPEIGSGSGTLPRDVANNGRSLAVGNLTAPATSIRSPICSRWTGAR
ncbi:MAG: VCBS repeat-containing protein [Caldilineaceae bacterium]